MANYKIDYEHVLNKSQYEAVTSTEGPVMIIAGAGSGKTNCLIHRVSYLIENDVPAESILLLTFTNNAANEMKKRSSKMLDERCNNIIACTYHSFCATLLRKYGKLVGISNNFTIITPSEAADAVSFTKAQNPNYKGVRGFPQSRIVVSIFSSSINKEIPIQEVLNDKKYSKYSKFSNELESLYIEFQKYKKSKNILDYDDLMIDLLKLLETPEIKSSISRRYTYIMVDEYQDTNNIQEKIILALREINKNIAVVGDDYQSIYAFRGSNVKNFIDFPKRFPGCKEVTLSINYRSTTEILNLANIVMNQNANFGYSKNMVSNNKNGALPVLWRGSNQKEEADYILNKIDELHKSGIPYNEIAILERNSSSSFLIESLLNNKRIEYDKKGGLKLLEHECVLNLLAYLRCLTNPYDELAWFRILQIHPGIGDTYAKRISSLCTTDKDFLINNPYKNNSFGDELYDLYDEFVKLREMSLEDDAFRLQYNEILDFYIKLKKRVIKEMKVEKEENREQYLLELKAEENILLAVRDIALIHRKAVDFLDSLVLDSAPNVSGSDDKLVISTIHSAKGLEYKAVFILDCVEGIFPNISSDDYGTPDDNEELRCFYVALTRAKDLLYIMCPSDIVIYGKYQPGFISHYLKDCNHLMKLEL